MNASTRAETLVLAKVDQKRLELLAGLAGRSPKALFKFVLRDGFDAVEEEIHDSLAAMREIDLNGTVPHADVMRSAKKIIDAARDRKHSGLTGHTPRGLRMKRHWRGLAKRTSLLPPWSKPGWSAFGRSCDHTRISAPPARSAANASTLSPIPGTT